MEGRGMDTIPRAVRQQTTPKAPQRNRFSIYQLICEVLLNEVRKSSLHLLHCCNGVL